MSYTVQSAAVHGLNVEPVSVEVDISFGLKKFNIVGLPDRAVSEACGRVESAIKNSGLPFPRYRITVNLAPASLKKQGPSYDLPIAIGLLYAQGHFTDHKLDNALVVGELGLDGVIRHVDGVLPIALAAVEQGIDTLIVPKENEKEAALVAGINIIGVGHLKALAAHIEGTLVIEPTPVTIVDFRPSVSSTHDMIYIKGQERAKRALEIAAAGQHNILLSGPPGSGKTMLARTLPTILPDLTLAEALDITRIHSIAGKLKGKSLVNERPFQSPHHTTSGVALIGGGSSPRPGQISMAHRGVLFLDEFPEFKKNALENLRQPLEDGTITVSRAAGTAEFPAKFMLVAAMNPCPCGFASDPFHQCVCTHGQIIKYQKKLSGPLLDRIDLHLEVPKIDVEKLTAVDEGELSSGIRARVQAARDIQTARFAGTGLVSNTDMRAQDVKDYCPMEKGADQVLTTAARSLHLSARAYIRIIKVSRTIADLAGVSEIQLEHVSEALQFRERG
ncbi:YifB family Mg chelatase-like AAA ATPase [Candidatus Uhrbacteria bacterium]|nr:YifB family Mg chelatase-like AAA ATPase [Candidatus Uhrbacteria bacterium]